MEVIIQDLTVWIKAGIDNYGYLGVIITMGLSSACIPLPTEVIMPYAGYLIATQPDKYSLFGMTMAGGLGSLWGSLAAYWIGLYGGRPFVEKYGRYMFVNHTDIDRADVWFQRYGDAAILVGRQIPVVRTFMSLPAGVAKMHFWRFTLYTFFGSLPSALMFAYMGQILGENWEVITTNRYVEGSKTIVVVILLALVALYIYRHIKNGRNCVKNKQ